MKQFLLLLVFAPALLAAQSFDGYGSPKRVEASEILSTSFVQEIGFNESFGEKALYKKKELISCFEWIDYTDEGGINRRYRREYVKDYFLYDESLIVLRPEELVDIEAYGTIRHVKKMVRISEVNADSPLIYDAYCEVYRNGVLQSTLHFEKGRPHTIYINHYYDNGLLKFVRKITSEGVGEPLRNTGVSEAYYPDGSFFENPITEDGSAIIILDEEGVEKDQCACMNQDVMEWGRNYLYSFIGKYAILIEQIYQQEDLECCWE